MHIGSGSKMQVTSDDAPQGVAVALTSLNAYMSMADWLLMGVLIRFPRLKITFSESQVGWMPFLLERVDHVFKNSKSWSNLDPVLTELPVVVHDLPAGEKRIAQRSIGFLATIVNGEVLIADAEPTGARPGQLIRGPLAKRVSNGSSTARSI